MTGGQTVMIGNTVVNWGIKCRNASGLLRRSIYGSQPLASGAEPINNALFKLRSAMVSQETNCCGAQQVAG